MTTRIPLRCDHPYCGKPYAEWQRDPSGRWILVITSRHDGHLHVNTYTREGLEEQFRTEEARQTAADVVP